jgi:hypothetical protein
MPTGKEAEACLMPHRPGSGRQPDGPGDPKPVQIGPDGKQLTAPYNPDTMALFHDIVFSPGYQ